MVVDPCELDDCVDAGTMWWWRLFKWLVPLLLLLLVLFPLLRACNATGSNINLPTGEINPGSITINGTGDPGIALDIYQNGLVVDTVVPGDDRQWSTSLDLAEGNYEIEARPSGYLGPENRWRWLAGSGAAALAVVAANMPEEPTVVAALPAPTIGEVDIAENDNILLAGTGAPGETLNILVDGASVGSVVVGSDGNWTYDLGMFDPGTYEVVTQGYDQESNLERFTIAAPEQPVTLAAPLIAQIDAADSGNVTVSGSGEPGETLDILVDGAVVDTVTVDADGNWTYSLGAFDPNTYSVMVQGYDQASDPSDFTIQSPDPTISVEIVEVNPQGGPGEPVTLVGTATPNSIVTLMLNGVPFDTVETDANGNWTFTGYFPAGEHTLTAMAALDDLSAETAAGTPLNLGASLLTLGAPTAGQGGINIVYPGDVGVTFDAGSASALSRPSIGLILDSSWSMTFPIDSSVEADRLTADNPESRIAIAKASLLDLMSNDWVDGNPILLRSFGNRRGNLACDDNNLMYALQPANPEELSGIIQGINPQFNANTSIATTLRLIGADLAQADGKKVIVLLTDGDETCGGDPSAEITALNEAGIDVQVNVIGFAVSDDLLRSRFEEWATLGNGVYYDANEADQLITALNLASSVSYRVLDLEGTEVATGSVGGQTVELAPGLYRIEIQTGDGFSYQNIVVTPDGVTEVVTLNR